MTKDVLKIGVVGLDTSHSVAFARLLNVPEAAGHVPGGRIVAAVKTFSPDMPASAQRVEGFTAALVDELGVRL